MVDMGELKFRASGLIPAIIQDAQSGEVLMMAYMNREALEKTLQTGRTWFWSRSRQQLWQKGETSGHYQVVKEITADCDYDALLIKVEQLGPGACHEGYRSCFHNPIELQGEEGPAAAAQDEEPKPAFDAEEVYGKRSPRILNELYQVVKDRRTNPVEGSYTNYLFAQGLDKILKKIGEEAAEVIIAAKNPGVEELVYELADLYYHTIVLMVEKGTDPGAVFSELKSRR
ncbi:MAG TPA: bifunctional phosphoribosyl-AMP cyclohydrolase/phosphoribosyl-ATP diphosphatase HisIE [Firmicutes bacterium]|nr:bifunctional phosphoribosyl-AMP cyclohydrolase/phosphoribosyl-ATP diphosphatase HisIE [Bacillota bacterium]